MSVSKNINATVSVIVHDMNFPTRCLWRAMFFTIDFFEAKSTCYLGSHDLQNNALRLAKVLSLYIGTRKLGLSLLPFAVNVKKPFYYFEN